MPDTIPPTPKADIPATREYSEGWQAHQSGNSVDTCPYESRRGFNSHRFFWLMGYYDRRWRRWVIAEGGT